MKFSLVPQEKKFFSLFEESAANMVKIARSLQELVFKWEEVEKKAAEISDIEHHGDTLTHQIIALLHRTFVTPFDREDIALLAQSMDDVTDLIHAAVDDMYLYHVSEPTRQAKELADINLLAALEVQKAVPLLRNRSKLKDVLEYCVEINRLENMADRVYRQALADLFEKSAEPTNIIKWREIYQHLETATDRCEDVANVLEGIALKHA